MTADTGKRARRRRLALFIFAIGFVSACTNALFLSPAEMADRVAKDHGWRKSVISAGAFDLTTYSRISNRPTERLTVYLEGDGYSWLSRSQLSADPTPRTPYVLKLAVRHDQGNILYLARPCQYVIERPSRNCHPRFWAGHRYSTEVVDAMDAAVQRFKTTTGVRQIVLVGYSGGGVVAALLAARRTDVAELVTIAANLDQEYWTRADNLTPLRGSLNPADFTRILQNIPQRHFVGADDDVVSPRVVDAYVRRMEDRSRTRVVMLKGFDHDCCWVENWPGLLERHRLRAR